MKRILCSLLLVLAPHCLGNEMKAVELYSQDELLKLIRHNAHLKRVRQDECQLVQDIEARARVLKLPAYQFLWADMQLYGVCVDRNVEQGFHYLEWASEQGLPDALEQLGRYYIEGRFVVIDEPYGLRLLHQAAALGHHKAQLNLARHYVQGKGSPRDYPEVYRWLHGAVFDRQAERDEAQQLMQQLAAQLPPSVREQTRQAVLRR